MKFEFIFKIIYYIRLFKIKIIYTSNNLQNHFKSL